MSNRKASLERATGETKVTVEVDLDGAGRHEVSTGLTMLDHMLSQLARHGAFDIRVTATCQTDPDGHHVVEDVAILLGRAFGQALGERKGIARMAHAVVPLDEALAMVVVDVGGRGYAVVDTPFGAETVGDLTPDLARHFLETFALEGKFNLHAKFLAGVNDHHKIEALFKALARALDAATRVDPRIADQVPSTKGVIES
ncbi:MAG: imidazoleglycerol-phosphate dehydratase HisB [Dehalococcoidia bacterium]